MVKVTVKGVIETAIISAFTIAVALIWKDVLMDIIELIVPPGEALLYKFLAAIFATILMIIAIYILLQTEYEAQIVVKKLRRKQNK